MKLAKAKNKPDHFGRMAYGGSITAWTKMRHAIIERDNFICRICGAGSEAKLNVHHISWNASDSRPSNLATLCSACHHAIHLEGYRPDLYEDWPAPWGELYEACVDRDKDED